MRKYISSVTAFYLPLTLHFSLIRSAEVLINEVRCRVLSQDTSGMTPLHIAAENNNVTIVKWLMKAMDCNSRNHNGRTALHLAAAKGYTM